MTRRMRLALATAVAALLVPLTGCDDRECLEGHQTITLIPIYNAGTKTTMLQPMSTFVCDRYAPEAT